MDRDETDNPSSLAQPANAVDGPSSHRRIRWRLALAGLLVAVLAAVGLVGFGLVYSRCSGSAGPGGSPVCLGSDGIPNQLDGQRVYRVTEQAEWQNLSGSFLLGGYGLDLVISCPTLLPQPSAEADLLGQCGGIELAPVANEKPRLRPAHGGAAGIELAVCLARRTGGRGPSPHPRPGGRPVQRRRTVRLPGRGRGRGGRLARGAEPRSPGSMYTGRPTRHRSRV